MNMCAMLPMFPKMSKQACTEIHTGDICRHSTILLHVPAVIPYINDNLFMCVD